MWGKKGRHGGREGEMRGKYVGWVRMEGGRRLWGNREGKGEYSMWYIFLLSGQVVSV